jgi:hypothetical protein
MDVKEYERRFEKAYSRLVEAHGFFFVWRALQKKEYEEYWKGTANFWNPVISALDQSWMLSLAKIYENSSYSKNDEVISIHSLVEHQPDTKRKEEARKLLEEKKNLLKNIEIVRHHILAHNNAEHKISREEVFKRFPIKYAEIEALFSMTEELFHLLHPEPNHSLSMEGFNEKCETDVKAVMKKMKFWEDELLKHYERIKNGEPYSDFPPKS